MRGAGVKPTRTIADPEFLEPGLNGQETSEQQDFAGVADRQAQVLRLLWDRRRTLLQATAIGLLVSTLIAFLLPKSYTSTAQLMPPDSQSTSGLAMMAAMAAKGSGALGSVAGDLLGLKSSGALFIGVLRSETSEDHIIQKFNLQKVYGAQLLVDARRRLDENTIIAEDKKSGIITISVTDHSAQRAKDIANTYVDELNSLVAQLSTSAAHREREFLEERLKVAKVDLDDAANQLAQFSSKNNTLDIQTEGRAMLDAAGTLAGQLIAAQSELEGLRQIYTDNNSRVRALNARVAELRRQLEKLGGKPENVINNGVDAKKASSVIPETGADPPPVQAGAASGKPDSLPFPTIRNLPLLGAKYADYYRRAKIQETVFEMLTEQYELAKVEEVKETPSVKVLDPAQVPERKSFPPRLLIMLLGTFVVFSISVVGVLGAARWQSADPNDPRMILAQEVAATLSAQAQRFSWDGFSRNGAGANAGEQKDLDRPSDPPPADSTSGRR